MTKIKETLALTSQVEQKDFLFYFFPKADAIRFWKKLVNLAINKPWWAMNTTGFIATKKIIEVIDNLLHLQAIFRCNNY